LKKRNISQGCVATLFTRGGICNYPFIANFPLSVTVKESKKIGQNLVSKFVEDEQEFGVLFF